MSGPRTGQIAGDVAFGTPGAIPTDLICGYSGAAAKPRAQIDAWGRPYLPGFESDPVRAYAGGNGYGAADADQLVGYMDREGFPPGNGYWFCAADSPSTPAQYLANVTAYAQDFVTRMRAHGRTGPGTPYGNRAAIFAARDGVIAAGSPVNLWGVGPWGFGEGGYANQPPDTCDADLLQSGNTPGPAPGTDLDWLYAPISRFAALGGPPTPASSSEEEPVDYIEKKSDPNVGIFVTNWQTKRHVNPAEWELAQVLRQLGGQPAPAVLPLDDDTWANIPDVTSLGSASQKLAGTAWVELHQV